MQMEHIEFNLEGIREYIIQELVKNKRLLFNELDLQMFVARALEQVFKEDKYIVHLEYRLPKHWNHKFDEAYEPWGETPYFDIVLEDTQGTKFIGIELKYKLKKIDLPKSTDLTRFGYSPASDNVKPITLVSNQAAENEGRYDFWKDVKRLELLGQYFEQVKGGIAIFVTNQKNYQPSEHLTKDTNKYSRFNLTEDKEGFLYWNYDKADRPNKGCQLECGEGKCLETACGERLKQKPENDKYNKPEDGEWGSKSWHYVRPNFSLKQKYRGIWSKESMKICTGTTEDPKIENFFCYSVLVPKDNSND